MTTKKAAKATRPVENAHIIPKSETVNAKTNLLQDLEPVFNDYFKGIENIHQNSLTTYSDYLNAYNNTVQEFNDKINADNESINERIKNSLAEAWRKGDQQPVNDVQTESLKEITDKQNNDSTEAQNLYHGLLQKIEDLNSKTKKEYNRIFYSYVKALKKAWANMPTEELDSQSLYNIGHSIMLSASCNTITTVPPQK